MIRFRLPSAPVFSVATPSLNALNKLRRCVGSVRAQRDALYEHLIHDAESSDGTPAWLKTQVDVSSVVESDCGMYDAINKAWGRARGQIWSWLNADEQYLPGTLNRVRTYFDRNPEVDVLFGDYIVVRDDGRPLALRREIPFRALYVRNSFLNMQSCTIFFRRRVIQKESMWLNTKYRYAADKDLVLRLATNGAVIRHVPEYFSLFGVDGTNLSTHTRAAQESESVRLLHGAFRSKACRKLVLLGRRIERLASKCYQPRSITYSFAIDEGPRYLRYDALSVGGRYDIHSIDRTIHCQSSTLGS